MTDVITRDMNRFVSRMRLKNFLGKLGLDSVQHDYLFDAAKYAAMSFGQPDQLIMSQAAYDALKKTFNKK